jgi:hypothetical protein
VSAVAAIEEVLNERVSLSSLVANDLLDLLKICDDNSIKKVTIRPQDVFIRGRHERKE